MRGFLQMHDAGEEFEAWISEEGRAGSGYRIHARPSSLIHKPKFLSCIAHLQENPASDLATPYSYFGFGSNSPSTIISLSHGNTIVLSVSSPKKSG